MGTQIGVSDDVARWRSGLYGSTLRWQWFLVSCSFILSSGLELLGSMAIFLESWQEVQQYTWKGLSGFGGHTFLGVVGEGLRSHIITLNHRQAFALPTSAILSKEILLWWRLEAMDARALYFAVLLGHSSVAFSCKSSSLCACYRHQLSSLQACTHSLQLPWGSPSLLTWSCRACQAQFLLGRLELSPSAATKTQ